MRPVPRVGWRWGSAVTLVMVTASCGSGGSREAAPGRPPRSAISVPGSVVTVPPTVAPPVPGPAAPSVPPETVPAPTPGSAAISVRRGDPTRAVVALTFDAGSDAGNTGAILDILAANGLRASFGLTGAWVSANPDAARRIVDAGHVVINHTQDHRSFTGASTATAPLSSAARADELARAESVIVATTGRLPRPFFRPPYGDTDASVRSDVGAAGYGYEIMWTVDSLGWKGTPPDQVVTRCLDGAVPGAIYLFHVGSASTDVAALQPVIDGLRARGYGFVTIAQMLGVG